MTTVAEIVGAVLAGRPLHRERVAGLRSYGIVMDEPDSNAEAIVCGRSLLLVSTYSFGGPLEPLDFAVGWRLYVRRAETDPDVIPGSYRWEPETDWTRAGTDAAEVTEVIAARADWMLARYQANLLTGRTPPKIATGDASLSGADFRVLRERLGVTTDWVARWMGVAERTVHRWDAGVSRVPAGVSGALVRLDEWTAQTVAEVAARFDGIVAPVMWTYRTDADLRGVLTESGMSASWHRALAARVMDRVPGLRAEYLRP